MIADTGLDDIDPDTLSKVHDLIELGETVTDPDTQRELQAHIENLILLGSPSRMAMRLSANRWKPYRHLVLLNRYLNDLASRRILRLLVTMPPRHGKSWTCSRYFPASYLARFPHHRVLLSSYEGRFAGRWGGMVRDTITANQSLLGLTISSASKSKSEWDFVGTDGGMMTAGAGGAITGKGANLFIIDDPVKNAQDAASPDIQENQREWYQAVASTRLEPDVDDPTLVGVVLLIMTRWHEGDLGGWLLNEYGVVEDGGDWTVLNLPAIAEDDNDLLGRHEGEALCPERFPLPELEKKKREVGSVTWAALYQQRPSPKGGNVFKRVHFRYFDYMHADQDYYVLRDRDTNGAELEHFIPVASCWRFQTVDLAATKKTESDWSVVSTWAVTPPTADLASKLLLLAVDRIRLDPTQHLQLLFRNHATWKPTFQSIDEKTFGIGLIESGRRAGLRVKPCEAEGDKYARALLATALLEAHHVYFDKEADWYSDWENELLVFDNGEFDDQVDTFGYAAVEFDRTQQRSFAGAAHKVQTIRQQFLSRNRKAQVHPVLGRI